MPPIPKKWRSVALEVAEKLQAGKKPKPLAQWRKELMAKGAKKEELDYMQVRDDASISMTHEELRDFMQANQFSPEETLRSPAAGMGALSEQQETGGLVGRQLTARWGHTWRDQNSQEQRRMLRVLLEEQGGDPGEARRVADLVDLEGLMEHADDYNAVAGTATKPSLYQQYTTHRERTRWPEATGQDYRELIIGDPESAKRGNKYTSGHWNDEGDPEINPIAHMRMVTKPVYREGGALAESTARRSPTAETTESEQRIINEWRRGDLDTDDLRRNLRQNGLDDDDIDQIMLEPQFPDDAAPPQGSLAENISQPAGMSYLEEGQSDLHQSAARMRMQALRTDPKSDVTGYADPDILRKRALIERDVATARQHFKETIEPRGRQLKRDANNAYNNYRVIQRGQSYSPREKEAAQALYHKASQAYDEYVESPEYRGAIDRLHQAENVERGLTDQIGPYKAPWASSWPQKTFQRLITDAVEKGNTQVGFTTGEVQRARWPTEKQQGALYDTNLKQAAEGVLKPFGGALREVEHQGVPSYVADVTPEMAEAAKKGWPAFAVPGAAVGLGALAMGAPDESEAANPLRWRATPGAWRPKPGEARFPELPPPETVYEPLDTAGLMGGYERQMGQELREPRRGILSEQSAVEMADEPLDPKLNAGIGLLSATRARDFAQMEHQPPPEPVVDLDPARDLWNTGAGLLGTGLGMAVDAGKMMTDWDRFISGHSDPLEQLRGPLLAGEEYSEEPMFGGDWFTRQLGGDPESKAAMAGSLMTPFPVGTVGKVKKGGSLAERAVEAGLSKHETTTPARVVNRTRKDKGYSVNVPSGEIPTSGLMMGMYRNTDPRNVVVPTPAFGRADVVRHAETNKGVLSKPNRYLGTYESADKGNTYLDVSRRFKPEQIRPATKFGEKTDQISGYNLDTREEFPVGNWGNFVESPQFAQRVEEMGDKGRGYLAEHPADQWWDMHGSAFERVYGTERLPNVAGYVASTAPVSTPETNLQTASEYLRRHIKGEPIIQPDWRVGPGEMTRKEGKRIGMERGRAANLRKSERGALSELRGPKVREEAAALMGDPNAVVLDRHQIRLSEDPAQGVYAAGVADAISPQGYERLKSVFTRMAQTDKLGRNARDLSADVWTGIRETIKNTSALYGTKFKGSAVQGESKSYADIFDDLIAKKAKHMGLSVNEMESRLRSGDATLLSAILGTSVGWAAYQESQKSQREDGALTADATL